MWETVPVSRHGFIRVVRVCVQEQKHMNLRACVCVCVCAHVIIPRRAEAKLGLDEFKDVFV